MSDRESGVTRPTKTARAPQPDIRTSVGKALALIGLFSAERQELGLSEMARLSGLSKTTTFRLLSLLVEGGLLARQGTRYTPSERVTELAAAAKTSGKRSHNLRDVALPYLEDLYELTHETIHLAVLEGTDVLCIEKIFGHKGVSSPTQVGARFPATCTALGKAMVAFSTDDTRVAIFSNLERVTPYSVVAPSLLADNLRQVRARRIAYDHEESRLGLTCGAAPILDRSGAVVAALSASGPLYRFQPERYAAAIRRAAAGVSSSL